MLDAVLFRTSGILTSALSPCHQSYLALLRQTLGDLAQLHVLTDLSLSLAPDLAAAELRRLSDTHEQKLSQQLNGVPTFAYTVADIVETCRGDGQTLRRPPSRSSPSARRPTRSPC